MIRVFLKHTYKDWPQATSFAMERGNLILYKVKKPADKYGPQQLSAVAAYAEGVWVALHDMEETENLPPEMLIG